jgi:sulfide:quinone oxidoreductase
MKQLRVIGAGTAGTMVVNRLRRLLDTDEWKIVIVDPVETHYYQPGFLFIPFGMYSKNDVVKPKRDFIPPGVEVIKAAADVIEPDQNRLKLVDGRVLNYDFLVIATGTQTRPEETPGVQGPEWYQSIYDFYTIEGRSLWRSICAPGRVADWCSTWSRTPSSARSRLSSSSCWRTGTSTSRVSAIGSS